MQRTIKQLTAISGYKICKIRMHNLDIMWRVFIDPSGNAPYTLASNHTLYYIPTRQKIIWRY
jgi:hypothetical protein